MAHSDDVLALSDVKTVGVSCWGRRRRRWRGWGGGRKWTRQAAELGCAESTAATCPTYCLNVLAPNYDATPARKQYKRPSFPRSLARSPTGPSTINDLRWGGVEVSSVEVSMCGGVRCGGVEVVTRAPLQQLRARKNANAQFLDKITSSRARPTRLPCPTIT